MRDEDFLTETEFEHFCRTLVENGILNLIEKELHTSIGFTHVPRTNFLDQRYYAFNLENDTIKQWLQISSEGTFRFSLNEPSFKYAQSINSELVFEKYYTNIILHQEKGTHSSFRLAHIINNINLSKFDLNEEPFQIVEWLFKAFKIIDDSRDKEVLYLELVDKITNKTYAWNIYNYNDKNKIIGYRNSTYTINKIKNNIEKFNNVLTQYFINIYVDKILCMDFKLLESQIIATKDVKKIGIILEDKMQDLVRFYIKENDLKSSFEISDFFYELFETGHDLKINDLNNIAYVFIEKNDLEKATELLNEAKRKLANKSVLHEDLNTSILVYYNSAIIEIKNERFSKALGLFKYIINIIEENDIAEKATAAALKILYIEDQILKLKEIKNKNGEMVDINLKDSTQVNIEEIDKYFKLNET
jgi:hypothetical protein